MRIGLITLTGYKNIGNRLQNFAVQKILEERGHEATTIRFGRYQYDAKPIQKISDFIKNFMEKIGIYTLKFFMTTVYKNPRSYLLREFDKKYVRSTTKYFFKVKSMEKYKNKFDYFCVGSDQVWVSGFVQDHGLPFLLFADSDKTFSFSASMGNLHIPDHFREVYMKGFKHVGHISVREKEVQDVIKNTVGRDSVVLLDPTMLIDKKIWLEIARKPAVDIPKKYVATYFLSETTAEQKAFIEKYAKDNGCEIVELNGKYFHHVGPMEFVYLIANSEFIFTDSFHGTAFSIIFNKRFAVFQRNNMWDMSSRIVTILNAFELQPCFVNVKENKLDDSHFSLIKDIEELSMSHIEGILAAEKKKMNDYLDEVFKS